MAMPVAMGMPVALPVPYGHACGHGHAHGRQEKPSWNRGEEARACAHAVHDKVSVVELGRGMHVDMRRDMYISLDMRIDMRIDICEDTRTVRAHV